MSNIEVLLYAVKFKTARGVALFLKALEVRGSHPGSFIYAGNRFDVPPMASNHRLYAESLDNPDERTKSDFPYVVHLTVGKVDE